MWAIVSDFDGTVTTFDVGDRVLLRFGAATKEDIARSWLPGAVVDRWMSAGFGRLAARRDEVGKFVLSKARLRAGFAGLMRACGRKKIPFEVASGGVDIYIRPLFRKWGFRGVRIFCARAARKAGGAGYRLSYPMPEGMSLARFKAERVLRLKRMGYKVAFCGDGDSDFRAARAADAVFARHKLHVRCKKEGVKARALTDFGKVLQYVSDHT